MAEKNRKSRAIFNDVHQQNRIGVREIRQDASTILTRVEEGEEFIVTNRGVPIARLIPMAKDGSEFINELIASGEIIEARTNVSELSVPTFAVKGTSASQLLIDERQGRGL
jgi:prevent-host-death family protein